MLFGAILFIICVLPSVYPKALTDENNVDLYELESNVAAEDRSRKAPICRRNQWQCRDGTCIPFHGQCDGVVDCQDRSDETHALCRNIRCQKNWFRCTYGACVDGTAPCNGIQDCADNSDELHPRCRNETMQNRHFKCLSGERIPSVELCDGMADCADGSDETVSACSAQVCFPYLFQCAYGACVDREADCNGAQECADGSDESAELCNRTSMTPSSVIKNTDSTESTPQGVCTLPPYPENGKYTVANSPSAAPGQSSDLYVLNVTCNEGYRILGDFSVYCFQGFWNPEKLPTCVRFCKLTQHPSVEYTCQVTGDNVIGQRACNDYEPAGTSVDTKCKPNYYGRPLTMKCVDGMWDYHAICSPGLLNTTKNTTITILIKDNVEIYVNGERYPVNSVVSEKETDYDIDENDWRMGVDDTNVKPKDNLTFDVGNNEIRIDSDNSIHIKQKNKYDRT